MISVIVMMVSLCNLKEEASVFVPPAFDDTSIIGTPTVPEDLGWQEFDAKIFKVNACGKIVPQGNLVDVWMYNPIDNNVWLKMRVLDVDANILGESNLIKPGEYIQSVVVSKELTAGTEIRLKIMAYQPNTFFSEGSIVLKTIISDKLE